MEQALSYFQLRGKPYWCLEQNGKKVHEYDGADLNESLNELTEYLQLLNAGRYTLKVRDSKNGQAGQSHYDFTIAAKRTTPMQPTNGITHTEIQTYKDEIRKQLEKEFAIEKRLEALEEAVLELTKQLKKLTDDDDENDEPALDRMTNVLGKMPALLEGIKAMKP